tara:strand:+ start:232 stop:762 length:531 start_codon:yes stop_codon:yes gene_type:complete
MSIQSEAAGILLSELIALGRKQIRSSEKADFIVEASQKLFGKEVDTKESAQKLLASLREPLLREIDGFGNRMADEAVNAVDAIRPEIANRTFLQCYGDLNGGAKVAVWAMVIISAIATGFFNYNVYVADEPSVDMMLLGLVIPIATLLSLCVLPIKSVAFNVIKYSSMAVESRARK